VLTPVNLFWVVVDPFWVGDLQIVGVVDELICTFAEGNLHDVGYELGSFVPTGHAGGVAESPSTRIDGFGTGVATHGKPPFGGSNIEKNGL